MYGLDYVKYVKILISSSTTIDTRLIYYYVAANLGYFFEVVFIFFG